MTKTVALKTRKIAISSIKIQHKFDEKYPDDHVKTPGSQPTLGQLPLFNKSNDINYRNGNGKAPRRHSWTQGLKSFKEEEACFLAGLTGLTGSAGFPQNNSQRRRSSAPNVHEVIEESPSDEEAEKEEKSINSIDYIKCINCSKNKSCSDDNIIKGMENMNFCFNCRHLPKEKDSSVQNIINGGRRSSWSIGDKGKLDTYKQSFRVNSDLPSIKEPESCSLANDKEDNKLKERVDNEVEKLIRFNLKSQGRRGSLGCEKEFKSPGILRMFSRVQNPKDKIEKCDKLRALNMNRTKDTVTSMKKHFML